MQRVFTHRPPCVTQSPASLGPPKKKRVREKERERVEAFSLDYDSGDSQRHRDGGRALSQNAELTVPAATTTRSSHLYGIVQPRVTVFKAKDQYLTTNKRLFIRDVIGMCPENWNQVISDDCSSSIYSLEFSLLLLPV